MADPRSPYRTTTFWLAVRDGWRPSALWRCFVARKHLLCEGCTPRCGLCSWCGLRLAENVDYPPENRDV